MVGEWVVGSLGWAVQYLTEPHGMKVLQWRPGQLQRGSPRVPAAVLPGTARQLRSWGERCWLVYVDHEGGV